VSITGASAAIAATAAIGLLTAACVGGAEHATAKTGDRATVSTPEVARTTFVARAPAAGTPMSGDGGFCDVVRTETANVKLVAPLEDAAPDPAELRVFYVAYVIADIHTAEAAPADIKGDAVKSAQTSAAFASALERVHFDVNKLPAGAITDDDESQRATLRVDAYIRRVCAFDRTTG
jgi:hypothetical protein